MIRYSSIGITSETHSSDSISFKFSKTDNVLTPYWVTLSLTGIRSDRVSIPIMLGKKQTIKLEEKLNNGWHAKSVEMVKKKNKNDSHSEWYAHLILEKWIKFKEPKNVKTVVGIDLGENNFATAGTSVGKQLALDMYLVALRLGLKPALKSRQDTQSKSELKWDTYFSSQDDAKYLYSDSHNFVNSKTRSQRRIIVRGNKKFILTPITKIIKKEYNGKVHNLTTENNVYIANYILNHNCDPPYYNVDKKGNFTRYTSDDFHISKRLLVSKVFKELDRLGCKVMLSNSDSPIIQKEFKDFNIKMLKAKRIVNSDGKNRGYVYEVVVMNYQEYKRQMTIEDAWG